MNDAGFLFIPEHIMEREDLSLQEKCVYGRIIGLTKKEGYCYATNEWIGLKLGLSGSMVSKHISSLTKMGLLEVIVNKVKKSSGAPQDWGTRRKIYIYYTDHSNPSTINGEPPSTMDGEYSNRDNSITDNIEKIVNTPEEVEELLGDSGSLSEFNRAKLERRAKKNARLKSSFVSPGFGVRPTKGRFEQKRREGVNAEDVF